MRITFHRCCLFLLCLVFEGCGERRDVQTDVDPDQISPVDEVRLNSMPEGFPDEVPIYPETTFRLGQRTETGFNVTLLTGVDFDSVAAYYRDQFDQSGWTLVTDEETEVDGKSFLRLVGDSESLTCTVDIAPGVNDKGEVSVHGITIYVEEKDPLP